MHRNLTNKAMQRSGSGVPIFSQHHDHSRHLRPLIAPDRRNLSGSWASGSYAQNAKYGKCRESANFRVLGVRLPRPNFSSTPLRRV